MKVITIAPKYLNLAEASRYCGLAKRTLEDAAKANKFENYVRARRRLIVRTSLDAWIEGREVREEAPETIAAKIAWRAGEIQRLSSQLEVQN